MARIFILVVIVAAIVVAINATGRAVQTTRQGSVLMSVKTVSYVLLILLMLGVVTGTLGGL